MISKFAQQIVTHVKSAESHRPWSAAGLFSSATTPVVHGARRRRYLWIDRLGEGVGKLLTLDEVLQRRDEGLEDYYQSLRDYPAIRDIGIEPFLEWYEKAMG